eukprot:502903_1
MNNYANGDGDISIRAHTMTNIGTLNAQQAYQINHYHNQVNNHMHNQINNHHHINQITHIHIHTQSVPKRRKSRKRRANISETCNDGTPNKRIKTMDKNNVTMYDNVIIGPNRNKHKKSNPKMQTINGTNNPINMNPFDNINNKQIKNKHKSNGLKKCKRISTNYTFDNLPTLELHKPMINNLNNEKTTLNKYKYSSVNGNT